MKLVITGGHHSSAIPVINKIREKYPDMSLYWIGHRHSLKGDTNDTLEYKEINLLGIPFYDLKAGKVYRNFNIISLLKVPYGFFQAYYYLKDIHPDAILSFGGYLAVPVVVAGWFLHIPSVTHEQTAVVGYANKIISRFAKKILVSWKSSLAFFPKEKTIVTGIPIRESVFIVKTENIQVKNHLPFIYITAGKTGSHKINELVKECLPQLLSVCNVIHQCGDNSVYNDFNQLESIYDGIRSLTAGKYFLRKFVMEDEIGEVFSKSSLVIARSGAHTITELLWLRKPSILIPLPWVSHNEQYENAKILEKCGLAKILPEETLTAESLVHEIIFALNNTDKFFFMDNEQLYVLNKNAAENIADEIYKTAKNIS